MGLLYSATQTSTALSTSADAISLKAAAARSFILREFTMSGMGTSSSANEVQLARNTGGTIATALAGLNASAPTSGTSFGVGQGTTVTTTLYRFALNANGVLFRWVGPPGACFEVQGATQLGWRSVSGTSNAVSSCTIEEF